MRTYKPVSRSLSVVVLFALVLLLGAAAATAGSLEIKEVTLDNGLRIFVMERSTSPTFAAMYVFGVGGTSDPRGRSGIAHLLEHMMFKGTSTVGTIDHEKEQQLMARLSELWGELHAALDAEDDPFREADQEGIEQLQEQIAEVSAEHKKLIVKNEYDELMTRAGQVSLNASTNQDMTAYYIQLPSNRLELWFQMESDRLLNPVFREFYSERDVVHEERRMRTDNTASGRAREALSGMLFSAHPYGVPVVGWPRDLERLVREDAMDYFKTYYSPSNCTIALVGDLDAAEVERLAKKYMGKWERQEIPRLPITTEPAQEGERRQVIEFDAKPQLRMGWLTVPEGHPDQYALDALAMVLGGLQSSRFDETIVQQDRIGARVGAFHPTMKYAGYFSAAGTLRGEHTAAELEQAIEREIERIKKEGITEDELERAKVTVEASRVGSLKSNMGQAYRIATAVFASGGTDYIEDYENRINAVTTQQVQEVAKKYLKANRKNVVEVRAVEGAGAGGGGRGRGVAHQRGGTPGKRGSTHSTGFAQSMQTIQAAKPVTLQVPEVGKDVQRVKLDGGVTVFIMEDHTAPSVEMRFAWLGGANTAPVGELAVFELAGDLLDEGGTQKLTPAELQARKDELGMNFRVWIGSTQSGASFWSLARNFDQSFDLALEIMTRPRFDEERLQTLRGQYIDSMRRRTDSPGRAASVLLQHVIFGEHPRLGYTPTREEIEAISAERIRQAWSRYLGRDNLFVTVVGDFESAKMLKLIESKLGTWRKAKNSKRKYITHDPFLRPGVHLVEKDVPQPAIRVYHQIAVDRTAPMEDHAALEILNDILGGSGFRSRLMERLRSDEGLTYGIRSGVSHQSRAGIPGAVSISYQTKQESVAHSVNSVLEEFEKIIQEEVNGAEVQEQIEAWRNRFIFRYTNDFFNVTRLMYNELDDRPYDFDKLELEAVQKVGVKDVRRVARKYLKPENLTIAVFGKLTEEDAKALADRFETFTAWKKEDVFRGGYEEQSAAVETAPTAPAGAR